MKKTTLLAFAALLMSSAAVAQEKYERGILFELFTGQECPSCPASSEVMKKMMADYVDNERYVWISHHAGYNPDSLTIRESIDLKDFFDVPGAPYVVYNRSLQKFGVGKEKLCQSAKNIETYNTKHADYDAEGRTFVQKELEEMADVSLNIKTEWNRDTRELEVTVFGEKNSLFDASAPAVSAFLVEDSIEMVQNFGYGSHEMYQHKNPVRHMLSGHYLGDMVEFDADNQYSVTYSYTVPEKFANCDPWGSYVGDVEVPTDADKLYVVALISNRDESEVDNPNYNRGNIKVYNVARCRLGESTKLSAGHAVEADKAVNVHVADGRIVADGEYDDMQVYTVAGTQVANSGLQKGLYLVRVVSGGKNHTVKVVVR